MKIKKTSSSRVFKLDFKNLSFGNYYSDHMFYCKFINGKWKKPIIKPFNNLKFSPITLVFHYGQAIFEGMKAYKDKKNNVFLFRPEENFKRMNNSAKRLEMPLIPKSIFIQGIKTLIKIDKNWIPKDYGKSLYIRPFMIANKGILSALPSKEYIFMIISTPSESYYNKPLKIKIEQKYSRSAEGGIGYTKAAGNYAMSFYPTKIAQKEGYDQLLWTDSSTHKIIEESGTMNVFFHIKNKLITPPANKKILNGITRKSLIFLAKNLGIKVEEKNILVLELIKYLKKGLVKEAFGCGTAVVINFFKTIGYKGNNFNLPILPKKKRLSIYLKKKLLDIQHNIIKDKFGWLIKVNNLKYEK